MNIKLFKKLIKEAVIEAIYEELPDILNESLVKFSKKQQINESVEEEINFDSNDINTNYSLPSDIRRQLAEKMGNNFGFSKPEISTLKIINEIDPKTGNKKNPFEKFIRDSAANLTAQELAGLRNLE